MARRPTAADLALVPCACRPGEALPDGTPAEWLAEVRAVASRVRDLVESGQAYWAVHWAGGPPGADAHVAGARVDGAWWGPRAPDAEPA